ncbi:carbohydrate ABC transporter permease [Aureibacillus halotolerans]|uniref:Carbohydrate ABC transporter membrane protein 1 (CUT1 family) n=1 Tax=Aureibacillus halotolerans TaxID=1508390 RepID=A0A4R6U672_9BACI|nr:sugar ABC transporter permease [Aureibacillus halotolerans]TDQ41998.1 carbohydrate ABC transporter membrane protein 1 (CUT1 family) [Aureibacillus halotolerans]
MKNDTASAPKQLVTNEVSKSSKLWKEIRKNKILYLFISPFYILFLAFGVFPILYSIFLSFQSWNGLGDIKFVGLAQFQYMLTEPVFWTALGNTFAIWFISSVPMLLFAMIIAVMLNVPLLRFRGVYRTLFFVTNVTSIVAVAIIFQSIFNNEYGLLNYFISLFGVDPVAWINNSTLVKFVLGSMVVWRFTGYNAIIYLAGLQSVPQAMYEAAKIDGASPIQTFFKITIPIMKPVILFTIIMTTIGSMQLFTEPQILLGDDGGIGSSGLTLSLYMYNEAFLQSQFGYAAAVSWALFILIGGFSLINWKFVNRL